MYSKVANTIIQSDDTVVEWLIEIQNTEQEGAEPTV